MSAHSNRSDPGDCTSPAADAADRYGEAESPPKEDPGRIVNALRHYRAATKGGRRLH